MKTHKDLEVYKLAIDYVTEIYRVTAKFPKEEQFGISNQMRRAAVSIPSNIAEGSARHGNKELIHFFVYRFGKCSRVRNTINHC